MQEDIGKTAERDPEVNVALSKQQKAIDHLSATAERVWDKFKPVIRDEPSNIGEEEKEIQSTVPLVVDLKEKTRRIQLTNNCLERLLGVCEL